LPPVVEPLPVPPVPVPAPVPVPPVPEPVPFFSSFFFVVVEPVPPVPVVLLEPVPVVVSVDVPEPVVPVPVVDEPVVDEPVVDDPEPVPIESVEDPDVPPVVPVVGDVPLPVVPLPPLPIPPLFVPPMPEPAGVDGVVAVPVVMPAGVAFGSFIVPEVVFDSGVFDSLPPPHAISADVTTAVRTRCEMFMNGSTC